jgi:signal transduction histidine kinase
MSDFTVYLSSAMKTRFIYIALLLSLVVLIWLGRIYLVRQGQQIRYTKEVDRTYQAIITLRNTEQLIVDAETSQRGYMLTHLARFRTPYETAVHRIDSSLAHLKEIIHDNPSQRVNIKLLEPAIHERLQILSENMEMRSDQKDFIPRLEKGKLIMDKIRTYIAEMEKVEYNLLGFRENEKNRFLELSISFLKYAFVLACIIFLGSIAMIIYELRTRIRTQKILEKTIFELKQSNEEIEQVSFAVSHDLQEPLRKIRTLSTLLTSKYASSFDSDEKDIIERIDRSTERMHNLLANLIDFTNLVNQTQQSGPVDLDILFMQTFSKLMGDGETALTKQTVLPVIEGYNHQLTLLFSQLLENSLKYRQPGRKLSIDVSYELSGKRSWLKNGAKPYHIIRITDNGIGFDKSFNERIFVLFQRLHAKEDYPGQGTGLTIARRIMTNHYGSIEADGKKGEGASFTLFFPAK